MMKKLSVVLVLLAGVFWGFMGVFVHLLTDIGFSTVQAASLRLIGAAVVMCIIVAIYNRSLFKIKLRDIWLFALLGVLSILMMTLFYFVAISKTSMSVAAVLLYTAPVFVMLASIALFKEKLTWQKGVALLLAVAGCAFVSGFGGEMSMVGIVAGVASGVCYASYSIIGTFLLRKGYHPFALNVYAFVFAAIGSAIAAPLPETVSIIVSSPDIFTVVIKIIACGVVTAVLPFMLYTTGLKGMQAGVAAILASIEPLVASVLGLFIYHEPPNILGIAMIIAAIMLVNNFGIKPHKAEEQ